MLIDNLFKIQYKNLKKMRLKRAYFIENIIKIAITQQEFSDFYALDAIAPYLEGKEELPKNIREETKSKISDLLLHRNSLVWKIANYYAESMHKAIIKEYYEGCPTYEENDNSNKQKLNDVGIKNIDKEIGQGTLRYGNLAKTFSSKQLIAGFKYLHWPSSFGGEPWANIAILYKELRDLINELKSYVGDHQVIRWHIEGKFKQNLKENNL